MADREGEKFTAEFLGSPIDREVWRDGPVSISYFRTSRRARETARPARPWSIRSETGAAKAFCRLRLLVVDGN